MRKYWTKGLARHLLLHPGSVPVVLRAAWRLRRANWWKQPPFLPLPGGSYWNFRMNTVLGKSGKDLEPRLLVEAAQWALRQPVGR